MKSKRVPSCKHKTCGFAVIQYYGTRTDMSVRIACVSVYANIQIHTFESFPLSKPSPCPLSPLPGRARLLPLCAQAARRQPPICSQAEVVGAWVGGVCVCGCLCFWVFRLRVFVSCKGVLSGALVWYTYIVHTYIYIYDGVAICVFPFVLRLVYNKEGWFG